MAQLYNGGKNKMIFVMELFPNIKKYLNFYNYCKMQYTIILSLF